MDLLYASAPESLASTIEAVRSHSRWQRAQCVYQVRSNVLDEIEFQLYVTLTILAAVFSIFAIISVCTGGGRLELTVHRAWQGICRVKRCVRFAQGGAPPPL